MIIDQLPSTDPNLTDETVTEQGTNLFKTTWTKIRNLFLSTAASFLSNVSIGGNLSVSGSVSGQGFYDQMFGDGTDIASNTDCDTMKTPGKFMCPNQTVAASLSNAPFPSTAFTMYVVKVASAARYVQIAIPNSVNVSIKIRYAGASSWTEWKTLTPE